MSRRRMQRSLLRRLALLLVIPLTVSSVGYALFSQQLSVRGGAADVAYSSSQYLIATYTKTVAPQGNSYLYSFSPMVIKNRGATSVTAWTLKFTVPSDVTSLTCPAAVTCTKAGTTVTIRNGTGNGTIAAGASTSFTISFVTATVNYTLQNVIISGTYSTTFQTIAGLTATIAKGTSSKKGTTWTWKPTITVTNSSGQSLSGWQVIVTPWSTSYAVTSTMPAGVSYTTTATQLTFTSTNVIANGASYQFIPTITTNTATWNPAVTIKGKA